MFLFVGCSNKTDYKIIFKDEMIIDLNTNTSPLSFIQTIDGHKITKSDIKDNKIIYKNFVIECENIDTSVSGIFNITYQTNDINNKEIKKQITVKDISEPIITLKKDTLSLYTNQINNINYYELFTVSDNSGTDNLKTEINDYDVRKEAGTYYVTIIVEDESHNKSEKKIKLIIKEKTQDKADSQEKSSRPSNNKSNKKDTNKKSNTSDQLKKKTYKSKKKNPSKYNKYFKGKSINNYNKAHAYAESILNSGKANQYVVMPDGEGFKVTFK